MVRQEREDAEKIRRLAELREMLEKKISDAESETRSLKILLELVNKTLLDRGFKRAEAAKRLPTQAPALPPAMKDRNAVLLRTVNGELLASLYLNENSMRVAIAGDKTLNVNTPPFQQFLVDRVLGKMREKDREASNRGEMAIDKILRYEVVLEGENLREIEIKNLSPDRMRELKSSINWTLEKMYEKTQKDA